MYTLGSVWTDQIVTHFNCSLLFSLYLDFGLGLWIYKLQRINQHRVDGKENGFDFSFCSHDKKKIEYSNDCKAFD